MNDIQELILEHKQRPYGMFGQGDMFEIIENYKASNIGVFNRDEIFDLESLNDKNYFPLPFLTDCGAITDKPDLDFGRTSVGLHNKIKKQVKNTLKITPLKITNIVWDTKERISAKFPTGPIKPGQQIEIEFDWKPLIGSRKPMHCEAMMLLEPVHSARMDQAIYS